MRLAFAGTPEFAAAALRALLAAGHRVEQVLTRPDRPQGRGLLVAPTAVKRLAVERGLSVLEPRSLRDSTACDAIVAVPVDVLVVAAYGLLLPRELLAWPRHGCLNIHASLLPRWRGAAPIQRALLAGDRQTGISLMQMDEGLDTGPVISAHPVAISHDDTAGSLHDKLAAAGAAAVVAALATLDARGSLDGVPQSSSGVTFAPKIDRAEARIDWRGAAMAIERKIRAFDPAPGAMTTLFGADVKLWHAAAAPGGAGAPGTVVSADASGIGVACGEGVLIIRDLQRAGGKRLPAASFLTGNPLSPGDIFF